MIRNYVKIALRSMWKSRTFSLVNLTGLVTGITACLLILQYVNFELSFDKFHQDGPRIYRIANDRFQQGKLVQHGTITYPAVGPAMVADFNEVESVTTMGYVGTFNLQKDKQIFQEKAIFADAQFLSMFTFPLLAGDARTALRAPRSIVISESSAKKIFRVSSADYASLIGKTLKVDTDNEPYEITAVMKDFPAASHLEFGALMSYETLSKTWGEWVKNSWQNSDMWHYVKLRPGADVAALERKLPAFSQRHFQGDKISGSVEKFSLQPLHRAHLFSDYEYEIGKVNSGKAVWTLLIIAAFILVIAWINYINLSTARSLERAREVGVRKVAGATSGQLIWQFMSESIILNLTAAVLSLVLTMFLQPTLNELVSRPLSLSLLLGQGFNGYYLPAILTGVFMTGIFLSGFYPAFALSGFKAIQVLKGTFKRSSQGIWVRKSLVVFQYTASIILIIGTFIIFQQLKFMREQKLGFNMDQVLVIRGPELTLWDSTAIDRLNAFKTELERIPAVQQASASGNIFGNRLGRSFNIKRVGSNDEKGVTLSSMAVDLDFFDTYKITKLAGRNFLATDSNVDGGKVKNTILNLAAVKLLGFNSAEEAINQKYVVNGREWEIVGVVSDFHQQSLKHAIEPIVFAPFYSMAGFFSMKMNAPEAEATIKQVKQKYDAFFPGNNFNYFFMDQKFNEQYKDDRIFGQISTFFSMLAVMIASLGIFGLSSYTIAQRTKEIGVRKVLGATVGSIVAMLSQDFIKLVLIAIVIGSPIAWYASRLWLEDFAYKIDIEWWMFAVASIVAIALAFATISSQAIKAALANPATTLKSE
ncbi:ABC transporter permease [Dyadobacter chenwenxiniae]|uniref:ABC transporter permease n=1 Tax=Dyadobacter chenwenxiniae TaxID=2906456 RepID=A0A9X1TI50_9BACT|nr:ABC transporter permease [Dyadobacter chenwenxiniae]MCF0065802.1 ABC transporter permease [Dyadobacter chenwenxiniae]UON84042.1 ABC transporter permease [Dyadobacter chenwenxiniae]